MRARMKPGHHRTTTPRRRARAFTLTEILVTLAILVVLLSLLLPAMRGALAASRSAVCLANHRDIGVDFTVFATDHLHAGRGDDEKLLPPGRFKLETFIEYEYQIDEFYPDTSQTHVLPSAHQLRCPEVPTELVLTRLGAFGGGIRPASAISYGFNARLHVNPTRPFSRTLLRNDILSNPNVPLAWDIDGQRAEEVGLINDTTLSTPPIGDAGVFSDGRYWSPALRHAGRMNTIFIDGHAEETAQPLAENWRWTYVYR